ncbi:hypothetical protein FVE85_8860 [Porphyridium purpureum]|uniref:Uncharacterized protein n=1 Tax=Porphyridium purpureum TaxID=35688 RepID=A0A5J4YQA9_PORPP|nr:hypothetical protein FVE85_8860 [Porphyridium purpureum]|eukprot:POR7760..scf296_7
MRTRWTYVVTCSTVRQLDIVECDDGVSLARGKDSKMLRMKVYNLAPSALVNTKEMQQQCSFTEGLSGYKQQTLLTDRKLHPSAAKTDALVHLLDTECVARRYSQPAAPKSSQTTAAS